MSVGDAACVKDILHVTDVTNGWSVAVEDVTAAPPKKNWIPPLSVVTPANVHLAVMLALPGSAGAASAGATEKPTAAIERRVLYLGMSFLPSSANPASQSGVFGCAD